jgi:pectinesterase
MRSRSVEANRGLARKVLKTRFRMTSKMNHSTKLLFLIVLLVSGRPVQAQDPVTPTSNAGAETIATLGQVKTIRAAPLMPQPDSVAAIPPKKPGMIRIALAGDSTMTDDAGWGVGFNELLADNVECVNMSRGGRSSGSFVKEGRWEQTLSLKPDYVLIQFGHNDQPGHGDRTTEPDTTFRENMMRYVTEARVAGAIPVLVTPLARRQWASDERIHSTLAPYAVTVRRIAQEMKVPLVELQQRSLDFYEQLGRSAMEILSPVRSGAPAAPVFDGTVGFDGTHLNSEGSVAIGAIVASELRRAVPELASSVRDDRRFIVVSPDARGDFKTLHEAIAAIPDNSALRTFVHLRPGIYDEGQIVLPSTKKNVTFEGEDPIRTILRYHLNVQERDPGAARGFGGTGVVILADDFHATNVWFENVSGNHGQALALRMDGDRIVMRNCRMTGWQDTLLINKGRQYFTNCFISGRVDFIYGNATAVFDQCEIQSRNGGHITAASTPQDQAFGFVFLKCKLTYDAAPWINPKDPNDRGTTAPNKADLGRPWREYACVAFLNCELGEHINPTGFSTWVGSEARDKTARYSEYESTGAGASPRTRLPGVHQLSQEEVSHYTIPNILGGKDRWDPSAPELPPNPKVI